MTPNICISRRSAGVVRVLELAQVHGEHPKPELFAFDLNVNSGPNGDDEISLQTSTREGIAIVGVAVDLRYLPGESRDRQSPGIGRVWKADEAAKGTVSWLNADGMVVIFLFRATCTDPGLADAAHAGAVAAMEAFLDRHSLRPREFRPRRYSSGYEVSKDTPRWRPCPRATLNGAPGYPTDINYCDELYSPQLLAAVTTEASNAL